MGRFFLVQNSDSEKGDFKVQGEHRWRLNFVNRQKIHHILHHCRHGAVLCDWSFFFGRDGEVFLVQQTLQESLTSTTTTTDDTLSNGSLQNSDSEKGDFKVQGEHRWRLNFVNRQKMIYILQT